MQNIKRAKQEILKAKKIIISGHINPDGDSIGSMLALGLGLKSLGKNVYMVSCDRIPKRYDYLPGAEKIVKSIKYNCDLAIAVDCSNKEILGKTFHIFEKAKKILAIDHHEIRRPFEDIKVLDVSAAAVGEMVYMLLKKLNVKISKQIAENLLTSIIVETNSFKLPNIGPKTFEICTKLVKKGIDFHKLSDRVFWSRSKSAVILTGICLSRCKFIRNNKIAWSIIRKKDFKVAKGKDEDVDAVADEIRAIKNVKIVVLFRENKKGYLRVSLRSKYKINVAYVAEIYGGGGHHDVAGCSIPNKPIKIKEFLAETAKLL